MKKLPLAIVLIGTVSFALLAMGAKAPTVAQFTPVQQTNVTGTGSVTIIAASGTNNRYRDLVGLTVTTINSAAATLTISDGTKTVFVLNYPNAASAPGTPLVIQFDPPIQQSNIGNAAWTATAAAVNASGYNVTAQFVER